MSPRRNPILQQTLAALRAAGAEQIKHWHGGKHIRLSAVYRGHKISATVALSPRCPWRAQRNQVAQVRRKLRAIEDASKPTGALRHDAAYGKHTE